MKRMLDQKLIDQLAELSSSGGIDWVATMKSLISEDDGSILIDNLSIRSNLYARRIISSLLNFYNEDEEPLFPLTDNAGKVLAVNADEDGLEAVSVSGGTQLYLYVIGQDEISVISHQNVDITNMTPLQLVTLLFNAISIKVNTGDMWTNYTYSAEGQNGFEIHAFAYGLGTDVSVEIPYQNFTITKTPL